MSNPMQTVSFHGQLLAVIPQQDQLFVAIKPICENIGIQWHAQRKRIHRDTVLSESACLIRALAKGSSMMDSVAKGESVMDSVAADGKSRELLCLPLEMLNGWLFGIDAKRIKKPEVKARVLEYQRECYQVLADYWLQGQASNSRKALAEQDMPLLDSQDGLVIKTTFNHRHFRIIELNEQYWFVAADVAAALGLKKYFIEQIPFFRRSKYQIGNQQVHVINVSGIQQAMLMAPPDKATAMHHWLNQALESRNLLSSSSQIATNSMTEKQFVPNCRWMLSFDDHGKPVMNAVPSNAVVLSQEDLLKWIAEPGGAEASLLPGILQAVTQRLLKQTAV